MFMGKINTTKTYIRSYFSIFMSKVQGVKMTVSQLNQIISEGTVYSFRLNSGKEIGISYGMNERSAENFTVDAGRQV